MTCDTRESQGVCKTLSLKKARVGRRRHRGGQGGLATGSQDSLLAKSRGPGRRAVAGPGEGGQGKAPSTSFSLSTQLAVWSPKSSLLFARLIFPSRCRPASPNMAPLTPTDAPAWAGSPWGSPHTRRASHRALLCRRKSIVHSPTRSNAISFAKPPSIF